MGTECECMFCLLVLWLFGCLQAGGRVLDRLEMAYTGKRFSGTMMDSPAFWQKLGYVTVGNMKSEGDYT